MPLSSGQVPIGATYAPSGGVSTYLVSLGSAPGKNELYVADSADLILRKTLFATSKQPVANAASPNGYTQQRNSLVFHMPILLANGNYTRNSMSVYWSYDPGTVAGDVAYLRGMLGHYASDADFDGIFTQGSIA
jgi:hypothetical protein